MRFNRRGGGKGAVSRAVGAKLMHESVTHDDGVFNMGGKLVLGVGPLGSGKTTLALQMAMGCMHTRGSTQCSSPGATLYPETVIYRGRQYDYWPLFLPENLSRSYPNYSRPIAIHHHANDNKLKFHTHVKDAPIMNFNKLGVPLLPYKTCSELYDHLIPGGFNVVYEPSSYTLPPDLAQRIRIRQFKVDDSDELPKDILKMKEEGKTLKEIAEVYGVSVKTVQKKIRQLMNAVPAPTSVWWFEFMETLINVKDREEWFSVFIDEAHQVFPSDCRGEHWHLVVWFSNTAIDLRRMNVTLVCFTHDVKLIDYRIVDRQHYFIWLPGSIPSLYRSRVSQFLVATLDKGEAIIERSGVEFGMITYERIPDQPPVVMVEGLPTFT